jgi:hypothetical protein
MVRGPAATLVRAAAAQAYDGNAGIGALFVSFECHGRFTRASARDVGCVTGPSPCLCRSKPYEQWYGECTSGARGGTNRDAFERGGRVRRAARAAAVSENGRNGTVCVCMRIVESHARSRRDCAGFRDVRASTSCRRCGSYGARASASLSLVLESRRLCANFAQSSESNDTYVKRRTAHRSG